MNEAISILQSLSDTLWLSARTLLPIAGYFLLFQIIYLKLPTEKILNVGKGLLLCLFGLTMFLFGVEYGFLPVGEMIGLILGDLHYNWILMPLGFMMGFVATLVEPAVKILCYEVEQSSGGAIMEGLVLYTLATGVGAAVALGMTRIIYGFPIQYLIIPGYLLILIIMIFTPPNFVGIAFDSGGTATGPMITTFMIAIPLGAAEIIAERDPILDGFGLIALVAMVPIFIIMLLGILLERKSGE